MHLLLLDPTLMCLKQEQATNGGSRTEQPGSGGLLPGVRLLFTNQPEKEKKHRERRERTSAGSLDLESGGPTTVPHRCALCASEHGLGCRARSCGRRTEPTDLSRKGTQPKNSMKTRSNQNESLPNFAQAITAEEEAILKKSLPHLNSASGKFRSKSENENFSQNRKSALVLIQSNSFIEQHQHISLHESSQPKHPQNLESNRSKQEQKRGKLEHSNTKITYGHT